jgi:hypothetical protein
LDQTIMKKIITLLTLLLTVNFAVTSQEYPFVSKKDSTGELQSFSADDENALYHLRTLAPIVVPELYTGPDAPVLPTVLDNSTLPFFRPAYNQDGLSCGQASYVGYMFTYEINRLRNLPGNVPANQYPTHFAWNWVNGGNGWYGASYFHSADLLRHVGTPNVTTYGGMSAGGGIRWMSGYDNYYHAMQNRIHDSYSIDVSTIEGLQILKHFLNDHLDGSENGGVATFYANPPPLYNLPPGTPEAGKKVAISWSSANHAMTIVGYHDSIRWDYNNDGQYTNHLDINGDGVVDLRDWEIGGLKMVNSYGGVPNWGDGGFCYMMYKTLADPYGSGGIWNNAVHVVKAKSNTEPQLTMKVTLKHNLREQIKVTAGLSLDPSATSPTIEMDFPIFHYQGDQRPMQGEFNEVSRTIEFGLDITPLLSLVPSGQTARYFLRVYEKDPNGTGTGDILAYSLMNYTSGVNEIICPDAPVPLVNNGKTTLWVNAAINYNPVLITNETIPDAKIYESYSTQLEATGGTPPYNWYLKMDYEESLTTQTFPNVSAQQLSPTSNTNGYATKALDFTFPFYGELYDTLFIHVNGLILFDRQLYPWPYQNEPHILFKGYKSIAPYNFDLRLYSGDGLWYEGDENSATFRWKASLNGNQSAELNFAVKIFPDGTIEYYYGNMQFPAGTEWIGGLSSGDYRNYQHLSFTADPIIQTNKKVMLEAPDFTYEMNLSQDGLFHGTPTQIYDNCMLTFMAVDNNNLFATKTLALNTSGLIIEYVLHSGNNHVLEFGETAIVDVIIKSMEPQTITNATMTLGIADPYIALVDSLYQISSIAPGDSVVFAGAFSFEVSGSVPNNHLLEFDLDITTNDDSWSRQLIMHAFAPLINLTHIIVQDGENGILDPGETTDIAIFVKNNGGALLNDVEIILTSANPEITINSGQATINVLPAGVGQYAIFNITASDDLSTGQVITFMGEISGHNNFQATAEISMTTGLIVESFESGNFDAFPWQFSGTQPWVIDPDNSYEGSYSARSGAITHNQTSALEMTLVVAVADSVSFYRKVSSESGYDFLKFYINGVLKGEWAGNIPWGRIAYPVSAGENHLKWVYDKDGSVSAGSDCAWIDYIVFPSFLSVSAGANGLVCEGETFSPAASAANYSSVLWTTSGTGTFNNPGIINPVYTPGAADITSGVVTLTITAQHSSYSVSDSVLLTISKMAEAYAGPDTDVCSGDVFVADSAYASNFANLLWTTSGDGIFSHTAILNPAYTPGANDLINGSVTLTLNVNSIIPCPSTSDEITLFFVDLPGMAATPTGPDSVDLFVHSASIYSTTTIPFAQQYEWILEPASAGTLSVSDTIATVTWNTAFSGYATLKVCGSNACGNGAFSETISTWVYDSTVDVPLIEKSADISISPNPSDGNFRLYVGNHDGLPFSISVYNLIGNAVYHSEGLRNNAAGVYDINLEDHPKGMYLLVFRSQRVTLYKKLVIAD